MLKPLPIEFLEKIAREYGLTSHQEEALVARYSSSDEVVDKDLAERLHISAGAFRTRMTGAYSKFSIAGKASGKFYKLRGLLSDRYQKDEKSVPASSLEINSLVQTIRVAIQPLIQDQCGKMRVLDMDQSIELTGDRGIYTNVNILEKLTRLRSEREVLESCGIEQSERLALGRSVRTVSGLKAVQSHRQLMVLGKPGAGKTTFLKYLAMQCVTGGFAADSVPFFVTLKDFAEAPKQPSLAEYLMKSLPKGWTIEAIEQLLAAGRAIVLLDGLDEVREEDTQRVIREVRSIVDAAQKSQFIMTCRIAAKEYTFERFTEVEVADFDQKQVETFVESWFRSKNDLPKAQRFIERLMEHKPIRELATSPLLLTLLCLVFGEEGDFPSNRSDLYAEGVKVLLKKWDAKRNIQRDDHYKKLDVQRREDLLSYVALQTFRENEYFVKQRRMEGYIADFISNLRDVDPEPESLRMDSEIVLKSIQEQHGLLVERARGIYSFSHLTFQEYFTAREIVLTNDIQQLVSQVNQPRWREVFFLTFGMMRNADELLLKMKSHIDSLIKDDPKLQQFLQWVDRKTQSVKARYKPVAIRAYYLDLALALDFTLDFTRTFDFTRAFDLAFDFTRAFDLALDFTRAYALDRHLEFDLDHALDDHAFDRDLDIDLALSRALDLSLDLDLDLSLYFDRAITRAQGLKFKHQLKQLSDRLPDTSSDNRENSKQWWFTHGTQWTEDLRQVMMIHRDIGHNWQFTDEQKKLLQQYCDANLLIIRCLNSDCYVSRPVRQPIEDTLLLPYEELRIENVE